MSELADLLRHAQAGDQDACTEVVQRFWRMAYVCAHAALGDPQAAEDACQEAFVDAFSKLPQLREPDRFPAWLRSIVRTRCNRQTRGWRPRTTPLATTHPPAASLSDPASRAELMELRARVREAVARVPEPARTTAKLFYFDGLGHQEIAGRTGAPLGTVKRRLHDARRRVKQDMERSFGDLWIEKREPL